MFVWIVQADNCGLPSPLPMESNAFSNTIRQFSIQSLKGELLTHKSQKILTLSLLGRVLLRSQIRQFSGVALSSIVLDRKSYGKPNWIPPEDYTTNPYYNLELNVSRNGNCIAVVASRKSNSNAIGCDVATLQLRPVCNTIQEYCCLMRDIFSVKEFEVLQRHATSDKDKMAVFFRFWTLKESFLKGLGIGISHPQWPLSRLEFTLLEHGRASLHVICLEDEHDDFPTEEWSFVTTAIDDKHILSIARHMMPGSAVDVPLVFNRIANISHLHACVAST
jgi:4'-phosphopantetheinyl transferase